MKDIQINIITHDKKILDVVPVTSRQGSHHKS